jgi:hypothetical protein
MSGSPTLIAFRKNIRAKDGATTATTPASLIAIAACSAAEIFSCHDHRSVHPAGKRWIEILEHVRNPGTVVLCPEVAPGNHKVRINICTNTDCTPFTLHQDPPGTDISPSSALAAAVATDDR